MLRIRRHLWETVIILVRILTLSDGGLAYSSSRIFIISGFKAEGEFSTVQERHAKYLQPWCDRELWPGIRRLSDLK